VADIRALVEQITAAFPRQAAVHRIGVHHQIVVFALEDDVTGEEHADALEQTTAFDVAGDHRDLGTVFRYRLAQQGRERRTRQHGLDAGHQSRIGPVLGDLQHHTLDHGIGRADLQIRHQADQVQQHGQKGVGVAAG